MSAVEGTNRSAAGAHYKERGQITLTLRIGVAHNH